MAGGEVSSIPHHMAVSILMSGVQIFVSHALCPQLHNKNNI